MKALKFLFLGFVVIDFGCSYFSKPEYIPSTEKQYTALLQIESIKRIPDILIDLTREKNEFEDDQVHFKWIPNYEGFNFVLKNLTNDTLNIIWDECLFVNESNKTSSIMHAGVKYSERETVQKPSPVASHAEINEVLTPTDYVFYNPERSGSGWQTNYIYFDQIPESRKIETIKKKYRIIFVISKENIKLKYDITFGTILHAQ